MDISGLEINQSWLRAIRLARSGTGLKITQIAQIPLSSGIIEDGKLADTNRFAWLLRDFLKKYRFSSTHWVVSLPEGVIYTTYKTFPNLSQDDLNEAIEINLPALMPGTGEQIYYGWQEIEGPDMNLGKEVMISSIAKNVLDQYLGVFAHLGLVPIAIEPKANAITRVFDKTPNTLVINLEGPVLVPGPMPATPTKKVKMESPETLPAASGKLIVTSLILNGGYPRLSREIAVSLDSKLDLTKALLSEVRRVTNFYLMQKEQTLIENIILDGSWASEEIAQNLKNALNKEIQLSRDFLKQFGDVLPSLAILGTGMRAMLDPRHDLGLSLLPVGAKEASEAKRVLSFFRGTTNVFVVTVLLFILIFAGGWGFLGYLSRQGDEQLASLVNLQQPDSQTSEIQKTIQEINPKLTLAAELEDQIPKFSPILKGIQESIPEGVVLTAIDMVKAEQPLTLTGTAKSRQALIDFREKLLGQTTIDQIQMPSSNFTEEGEINFTLTLSLKNQP